MDYVREFGDYVREFGDCVRREETMGVVGKNRCLARAEVFRGNGVVFLR